MVRPCHCHSLMTMIHDVPWTHVPQKHATVEFVQWRNCQTKTQLSSSENQDAQLVLRKQKYRISKYVATVSLKYTEEVGILYKCVHRVVKRSAMLKSYWILHRRSSEWHLGPRTNFPVPLYQMLEEGSELYKAQCQMNKEWLAQPNYQTHRKGLTPSLAGSDSSTLCAFCECLPWFQWSRRFLL